MIPMLSFADTVLWINLIMFLAYVPLVCYFDIRYREFNPMLWAPLVGWGCITSYVMYFTADGWYPKETIIASLLLIFIFWVMLRFKVIEGADYLYLCIIALFWVVNPYPTNHGIMQFVFYAYLMFTLLVTAVVVLLYNVINGHRWGIVDMMSKYPRGVPMLVPIAIAFVLSALFG